MTKSDIQKAMQAAFPVAEQRVAQFYAMQEYHLGWRDTDLNPAAFETGKLVRPQLALLTCRAVGGDATQALPLAAAIQLIHDFSLIHDDVEDQSDLRRGRPTVWKQFGLAHAVNVGDGMFTLAYLALHRLTSVGVPDVTVLEVFKRFSQTNLRLCEGQFLDMSFEGNLTISEADYLGMISRKTAALLAGAASMGALVGGADPARVEAFAAFGQNLGLAFQIQDDILGIWGEPDVTGKPHAADLYRRKVSLPIIYVLQQDRSDAALEGIALGHEPGASARIETPQLVAARSDLTRIYQQEEVSERDVAHALEILALADARQYSDTVAAHYHRQAMQALDRICPDGNADAEDALAQIRGIATKLLGRNR